MTSKPTRPVLTFGDAASEKNRSWVTAANRGVVANSEETDEEDDAAKRDRVAAARGAAVAERARGRTAEARRRSMTLHFKSQEETKET